MLPPQTRHQQHVHRGHETIRASVYAALEGSGDPALERRASRIERCCIAPQLRLAPSGSVIVGMVRCRDRLCPTCQHHRQRQAVANLQALLARADSVRMITLTAPAVDAPLTDQIKALKAAVRHLRRSQAWESRVAGGAYAWQITRNTTTGLWHPHVHLIVTGRYFPVEELRKAWRASLATATDLWQLDPDAPLIVDVRMAYSRSAVASYIARYITRPDAIDQWGADAIAEYATALHGLRLLHTFGSLHGADPDRAEPNPSPQASRYIASIPFLVDAARKGLRSASEALRIAALLLPRHLAWLGGRPPPPPDDPREPFPNTPAGLILAAQLAESVYLPAMHAGRDIASIDEAERYAAAVAAAKAAQLSLCDEYLKCPRC